MLYYYTDHDSYSNSHLQWLHAVALFRFLGARTLGGPVVDFMDIGGKKFGGIGICWAVQPCYI